MRHGQWAWALLLKKTEDEVAYKRIGLAKVDLNCFDKTEMEKISLI
jgi:hypothetical protein